MAISMSIAPESNKMDQIYIYQCTHVSNIYDITYINIVVHTTENKFITKQKLRKKKLSRRTEQNHTDI